MAAHVLVVDDDPTVRQLVGSVLDDEGYVVTFALDGQDAVEQAEAARFDAIVMDLQMPRLDGREAYRELRRRGVEAPVLILSAGGAQQARRELSAAAALTKPFDPVDLLRRVARMLGAPVLDDPVAASGG